MYLYFSLGRNLTRLILHDMPAVNNRPLIKLLLEESMPNCYVEGLTEEDETKYRTGGAASSSFADNNSGLSHFQQTLVKIADSAAIVEENKKFVDSTKHFELVDKEKVKHSHKLKEHPTSMDKIFHD